MQAFQAALRPSPLLWVGSMALHAVAVLAASVYFAGWLRVGLLLALLLSAAWAGYWQSGRYRYRISRIDVGNDGKATVFCGQQLAYAAVLRSGSLVTRYGMVLHWQLGDRVLRHVVSADMTDATSFRRLKVWACWAQEADQAA